MTPVSEYLFNNEGCLENGKPSYNELFLVKIRARHYKPAHSWAQQASWSVAVLILTGCVPVGILTLRVNN